VKLPNKDNFTVGSYTAAQCTAIMSHAIRIEDLTEKHKLFWNWVFTLEK